MIRAIVWKELREQGLIALTLVVLGIGVLAAAAALAEPPVSGAAPTEIVRYLGIGRLATLMLAVTAGIVCGGAVFAAEREAGTFSFLDSLPTSRWSIWVAKFIAGLGLSSAQIVLLIGAAAAMGMVPSFGWAIGIGVYSLLAFAWGMLGSTGARTTLGSVGIAIPAATLTAIAILIPVTLFFQSPGSSLPRPAGAIIFLGCMLIIPLLLSAWFFTSLDRARVAEEMASPRGMLQPRTVAAIRPVRPLSQRSRFGSAALLWLTARQSLLTTLVLSAFALLFGVSLLFPGSQPLFSWPLLTLTAGVVAGVTTFADEQTRGSGPYWGEQRLPIGRVWAFKIGVHLALCIWLLVLLALPMVVRSQLDDTSRMARGHTILAGTFRVPLFDELGVQGWKYLFVPAAYGFAAGHLCGLVFRKLVVACGVATIVGGVGAVAWGPSLLAGGVKHWQLWVPPAIALVTGRLLMRAWTAERINTRAALVTLSSGCAIAVLALGAGIGYRVLEIPDRPGGEDDRQFVSGLPPFDENAGGRDFRTAADRYARQAAAASLTFDRADLPVASNFRRDVAEDRLDLVPRYGWPGDDAQLEGWLNAVFGEAPTKSEEGTWHSTAADAARLPIGIYEYPQLITVTGNTGAQLVNGRRMAVALLARGLQRQAAGDPTDFSNRLRIVLALAKTMRRDTVFAGYLGAADVERSALSALDSWLERLPIDSKLIRPALEQILAAEPAAPFDPVPYFLAERYVLREGLKAPAQWLPNLLTPTGANPDDTSPDVDLVSVAWAVPWERERTRRLVGLGFESGLPENPQVVLGRPGLGILIGRARNARDIEGIDLLLTAHRRAAILKLALRAFRGERGTYPAKLEELVGAGYLRAVPADPYGDQRTFSYRISKEPGDVLVPPPRSPNELVFATNPRLGQVVGSAPPPDRVTVPPGRPILWCIGPDKLDQGGQNIPVGFALTLIRPQDLVYLVPAGSE